MHIGISYEVEKHPAKWEHPWRKTMQVRNEGNGKERRCISSILGWRKSHGTKDMINGVREHGLGYKGGNKI